jgi:hypothetical protein
MESDVLESCRNLPTFGSRALDATRFFSVSFFAYFSTLRMEAIRSSESWWTSIEINSSTTQKTVLFIIAAVRTSNGNLYFLSASVKLLCFSDLQKGHLDWMIEFIDILNIQLETTSNYSAIADLQAL